MQIDHLPIGQLHGFDDNPRTIDDDGRERLRRSLERFGLYKPLLCWRDESDRAVVIGGNQRLGVLREMSPDRVVPVVWFDGDRNAARLVAMRDNNSDGEWDWSALPSFVAQLDELGDLALTGFNDDTIADLQHVAAEVAALDAHRVEHDEPDPIDDELPPRVPKPDHNDTGDRFVRFAVGNVRGRLAMDAYGRWLQVFDAYSQHVGSTDLSVILDAMVHDWESS